ncbi:MAG: molybdopterin molybdotransferase MoeA [Spirosomataceae bacterium]
MISVEQATHIIQSISFPWPTKSIPLPDALGEILAEDILADRDLPPYDRVTMDGIAIDFDRFDPARPFRRQTIVRAGEYPASLQNPEDVIEVMTGAMLPPGCNTVIRYEDIIQEEETWKIVPGITIKKGQNIHTKGQDSRPSDVLVPKGTRLHPTAIGIGASVGNDQVLVYQKPSVLIVSSGEEIVPIHQTPEAFQIRSSNSYALSAMLQPWVGKITLLHVPDDPIQMEQMLSLHWTHDIILLTGGVSAGKYDFVPGILVKLGVQKHLQRVAQKPGKPIWFGTTEKNQAVFALPGNPASSILCTVRYVLPWIQQQFGMAPTQEEAILSESFHHQLPLTYFLQVTLFVKDGKTWAIPTPGNGSGDLVNLARVDGFLEIPPGECTFEAGTVFPLWRSK